MALDGIGLDVDTAMAAGLGDDGQPGGGTPLITAHCLLGRPPATLNP